MGIGSDFTNAALLALAALSISQADVDIGQASKRIQEVSVHEMINKTALGYFSVRDDNTILVGDTSALSEWVRTKTLDLQHALEGFEEYDELSVRKYSLGDRIFTPDEIGKWDSSHAIDEIGHRYEVVYEQDDPAFDMEEFLAIFTGTVIGTVIADMVESQTGYFLDSLKDNDEDDD